MTTTHIRTTGDGYVISYVSGAGDPYIAIGCPIEGHLSCGYSQIVQPEPGRSFNEQLNADLVARSTAELRELGCPLKASAPEAPASDAAVEALTPERTDELTETAVATLEGTNEPSAG